jgi:FkbM family methyltransferase
MSDQDFLPALSASVMANAYNELTDNVDQTQHPPPTGIRRRLRRRLRDTVLHAAWRAGFVRVDPESSRVAGRNLAELLARADGLGALHRMLGDERSRETLIAVLAFRVLGYRHVRLPPDEPDYWAKAWDAERRLRRERHTRRVAILGHLDLYDLHDAGFPIRLHAHLLNVVTTFVLQQYRYARGGSVVEARPGDVVVDGGGCWGDTALYFAHLVGEAGSVVCFEFLPENLEILRSNLRLNPELESRVQLVPQALWDRSGESLSFVSNGPGTTVARSRDATEATVSTRCIDDLVAERGLDRVDFIKLDIEGAELQALRGAERTLRRFRPAVAVCLYHRLDDFVTIPAYLRELALGYEFHLDHFWVHEAETVLFARPAAR